MDARMQKGVAWCLAAVLLLSLLPLAPRATAVEGNDLSQAEIDLDEWFYRYDKSPKEPEPTVKLEERTLSATDYTISYANNINAGQASLTITGTGTYYGSKTPSTPVLSCRRRSQSRAAIRRMTGRRRLNRKLQRPVWTARLP